MRCSLLLVRDRAMRVQKKILDSFELMACVGFNGVLGSGNAVVSAAEGCIPCRMRFEHAACDIYMLLDNVRKSASIFVPKNLYILTKFEISSKRLEYIAACMSN